MGMFDKLAAVNEPMLPVPVTAGNPTAGLDCVHRYSVPATVDPPNKTGEVIKLVHNAWSTKGSTLGEGFTSMENDTGNPKQVLDSGVTMKLATTGTLLKLLIVKAAILPVPVAGKPMFVLSFIHW